ncbi:MAG: LapA family protein [Deltaproteobacteria bacterium]|nr:LapA family protein [Deltaproteobacteria bacterium]MBW2678614.1 LapA family protein [Deltaproteobacteria bacterium]
MKNAKIAFWVILFGLIGLILYQNREFYMSRQSLGVDLMFFNYQTPEIHNAILFLGFFFIGLLVAYFFSLLERFNARKTIKNLSDSLRASEKILEALKAENDLLKNTGEKEPVPSTPSLDTDDPKDSDAP